MRPTFDSNGVALQCGRLAFKVNNNICAHYQTTHDLIQKLLYCLVPGNSELVLEFCWQTLIDSRENVDSESFLQLVRFWVYCRTCMCLHPIIIAMKLYLFYKLLLKSKMITNLLFIVVMALLPIQVRTHFQYISSQFCFLVSTKRILITMSTVHPVDIVMRQVDTHLSV